MNERIETDLLGNRQVPAHVLWGIHTLRAIENFPLMHQNIHPELIKAYGAVKLACFQVNRQLGFFPDPGKADAIEKACFEMSEGLLNEHIVVDALQGGAGTSTNMNVNEVIANRALQIMGRQPGEYNIISPLDDVNLHQSTNDTYPTALKVAAIRMLRQLEQQVLALQEAFQHKEKEFAHIVKVGRTQLQDAVLTTLGREMGAYAEAFNRDRWRIYKCEERLRVINLGGTAIGTGLGAPRQFIFMATDKLRELTGTGLARAENLTDCTMNNDVFVEVSGILKACASNLLKVSNDLRLLSSGPDAGLGEINLPPRQAGSSIMPGKVNPVIPEAVAQASIMVSGNDLAITQAVSSGNLELNQFMPLIAHCLVQNIGLLTDACKIFRDKCITGITANEEACQKQVNNSTAAVTALIPRTGYTKAAEVASLMREKQISVKEAVLQLNLLTGEEFEMLISPESVTRLGS
jgi:aspartate ammonia-lyase